MRIVIAGGGIVGMALARLLRAGGVEPTVLERAPHGSWEPRPFLLPFHAFECLRAANLLDRVRDASWDIAPRPDADPVAVCISFVRLVGMFAEDVPVRDRTEVVDLVRDGARVVGVRVRSPKGEDVIDADLVVACDGIGSPVREMAGIDADIRPTESGHLSFMTDRVIDRSFAMRFLSDGQQIGLMGWPEGSGGWWDVDRCGREQALAPGLDAFRDAFAALLPEARPALDALESVDRLIYREPVELRCPEWWTPGVVVIGDAAHFLGPEAGLGAGLGLSDALALSRSILEHPDDPDAVCTHYVHWHGPWARPYEAVGVSGVRIGDSVRRPEERWPPPA